MCQDVDIMTNIAWRRRVLLLSIFTLWRLLHLYLTLHVGLFDHFHLQEYWSSDNIHLTLCDDTCGVIHTSSLGLMLYSILSAFSLSWRLSIIARRSLEALFWEKTRVQINSAHRINSGSFSLSGVQYLRLWHLSVNILTLPYVTVIKFMLKHFIMRWCNNIFWHP